MCATVLGLVSVYAHDEVEGAREVAKTQQLIESGQLPGTGGEERMYLPFGEGAVQQVRRNCSEMVQE